LGANLSGIRRKTLVRDGGTRINRGGAILENPEAQGPGESIGEELLGSQTFKS